MNPFRVSTRVDAYAIKVLLSNGHSLTYTEFVKKGENFEMANFCSYATKKLRGVKDIWVTRTLFCACGSFWHPNSKLIALFPGVKIVNDYCEKCDTIYECYAVQEQKVNILTMGTKFNFEAAVNYRTPRSYFYKYKTKPSVLL